MNPVCLRSDLANSINPVGTMRLSSQELEEMDATYRESAAKFPESKGGGYMGDLEVFHELHCVVCQKLIVLSHDILN